MTSEGTKRFEELKIGFIGGGNMAKAIAGGIVKKGLLSYSQIYVSGPRMHSLESWQSQGANVYTDNGTVCEICDVIFLSVKPHILPEAMANICMNSRHKIRSKLFVSIIAGIKLEALENLFRSFDSCRIIRTMPNTPMMVGEGCTVYCPGEGATENDVKIVRTILEALGICYMVPESMIDAIGALAGSGPAFAYLMIEAMSDGGVKMGIPRAMATQFAAQTMLGAAKMVLESGKHTGALKDEVCSPGGTTITGVHALEKGGVRAAIMDAIECAATKSAELGRRHVS
ncbi:PREDICTED: pyrroline-5-carboxylate reductase-like [Nicrophorus vespilloides]|uniref:pyrroline-5-carboxylate reductase n=1 Tax=Nicrophorus vespilloides TaxID=110193 RepID=A0ABM1MDV0_NICVS|nr:PREDICTED: pyrroline-5-carboxylate reductase-like [Nicrophorus vespilloides]